MLTDYTPPPRTHQVEKALSLEYERVSALKPFITPEVVTLVREMMGWSPMATACAAAIRKQKLNKFEKGDREFSTRDISRLSAMFVAANIDIFSGQGEIQISLPSTQEVKPASELGRVFKGHEFLERRLDQGLSQTKIAHKANIPQAVVSGIETSQKQMGPFSVRLRHKVALQEALLDISLQK